MLTGDEEEMLNDDATGEVPNCLVSCCCVGDSTPSSESLLIFHSSCSLSVLGRDESSARTGMPVWVELPIKKHKDCLDERAMPKQREARCWTTRDVLENRRVGKLRLRIFQEEEKSNAQVSLTSS